MNHFATVRRVFVAIAIPALILVAPARAQEISESHLAAARSAITAVHATDEFDGVLPGAAEALKTELIRKDPHLSELITLTVDEKALELASRRGDIEKEAALAYARVFTEDELKAIAEFYNSPVGKKLISDGQIATREMLEAAEIWRAGIARDLAQAVGDVLAKEAPGLQSGSDAGQATQQ